MGGRKHGRKRSNSKPKTAKNDVGCAESTAYEGEIVGRGVERRGGWQNGKTIREEVCRNDTSEHSEGVNIPVEVCSRLPYPLVRPSLLNNWWLSSSDNTDDGDDTENGDDDDVDEGEDEALEWDIRPRFVFVSSLCMICLERSRLLCDHCRMVSYCSTTHRAENLAEHRNLCNPLAEISSALTAATGEKFGMQLNAEQYRVYRLELLASLEGKVDRPLELWEREIVLYPRVCGTCRRFSDRLTSCPNCDVEYFCKSHREEHEKWCEEFRIFRRCLFLQHKHGCVEPKIPHVNQEREARQTFVALTDMNFDELMGRVYGNGGDSAAYYRRMDCYTYSVLSHVSTIPLTTLYSMQISCPDWQTRIDWTVHVVGAEFQFEGMNLYVWEKLFLHFLPNLKRLRLILIGPELRLPVGVPPKLLSRIKLCKRCKAAGRTISVSFRAEKLYHELAGGDTSSEPVLEPDLVCAFNPGLYRKTGFAGQDSWRETIREFCRLSTPVAITAYIVDEMFWEMARLQSIAEFEVLLEPRRNPFASVKPDRNFVSDNAHPLIYKNYYISIVKGKRALV